MTIESLYRKYLQSEGISTDTRKDVKDTLFFALEGENFDGNRFVLNALYKGCKLAITERTDLKSEAGVVCVPSALKVLQQLAHHHRMMVSPRVIAITGSNGKTTTKELIASLLSDGFKVLSTSGNLNNHIGVPLTLLSLKNEEVAVIEMGANHPGEIAQLAEIAAPDMGLITNVGKAHLEGFGSEQGVLDAKGELFEYLSTHGGKAIVDGRDQLLLGKARETGVATLVIAPSGQLSVSGRIIRQSPFLEVELEMDGTTHHITTRLVGAYNLQNILLATGVGVHFGIKHSSIMGAISSFIPKNQRSQFVEGELNNVILDSYNANPSSMREAISGLLSYGAPPTMLILGDMAELGEASRKEHQELVDWIETLSIDRVMLVGPKFGEVCEPSSNMDVFMGMSELEANLISTKPEGYYILVKGSRVMELERILKFLVECP